jgi:hypothetical protein
MVGSRFLGRKAVPSRVTVDTARLSPAEGQHEVESADFP